MRVVFDGRALHGVSRYSGMGTYLWSLLEALPAAGVDPVVLATRMTDLPDDCERVEVHRSSPNRLRTLEHWWRLPGEVARVNADLLHTPANQPVRRTRRPWVHTLHDVIPLLFDDPFFRKQRTLWRSWRPAIARADAVVIVSRAAADDAIRVVGLDPGRVHVIPHGVNPRFTPGDAAPAERPYFLYVGEWFPHKGYPEAVDLIGRAAAAGLPHRLVVVGRRAAWVQDRVDQVMASARSPERVEFTGNIGDDELLAFYRGATALVVTSRYEGFGLPALEAMACGTPVVAFANSALVETVGSGGILVPDGDVGAMLDALVDLSRSPGARAKLVQAGLAHAARYRWEESARMHAGVYRAVAGRG